MLLLFLGQIFLLLVESQLHGGLDLAHDCLQVGILLAELGDYGAERAQAIQLLDELLLALRLLLAQHDVLARLELIVVLDATLFHQQLVHVLYFRLFLLVFLLKMILGGRRRIPLASCVSTRQGRRSAPRPARTGSASSSACPRARWPTAAACL